MINQEGGRGVRRGGSQGGPMERLDITFLAHPCNGILKKGALNVTGRHLQVMV